MRIIGGAFRGRKFHPPANLPVRPTTDFAREALFNILQNNFEFEELKVLDLFAGTGSITYELASRGCRDITAVDSSPLCIRYMEKIRQELGIEGLTTLKMNAWEYIKSAPKPPYDLVFADPPYAMERMEQLPDTILNGKLLKAGGILVLEHGQHSDFKDHPALVQHRKYGTSNFSIFRT